MLGSALSDGQGTYAFVMDIRQKAVIVNLVPISVDGRIRGALFSFQEGKRITELDSKLRLEMYQRGYIARNTFDRFVGRSQVMKNNITLAKRLARYSTPIFLTGEQGTGKGILAQCIHNESMRRGNAFVPLDCSAWQPETLDTMLFGNYSTRRDSSACMAEQARNGTLYLSHVDALPMETQYKVLNLVLGLFLHNGPNQPEDTDVRVIASTDVNLAARVEKGEFRRDLYYALNILSVELPVIMYNNKPKTNVGIDPATVSILAHEVPNIIGVKDSTGDMTNAAEYLRLTMDVRDKFNVIMGRDTMIYAALCYGASGAVASCANVAPRVVADIYDRYVDGDLAGALEAQYRLAPLRIACGMGTFPEIIKEGLNLQGINVGKCLEPIGELTAREKEKLRKVLADMKLI